VTIDLCPGGNEDPEMVEHLGTAIIHNDMEETLEKGRAWGSYKVRLSKWTSPEAVWRRGKVRGFRRKTRGPYDLLFLALLDIVGKRNRRHVREALESWTR
jgi:hypothetical protein